MTFLHWACLKIAGLLTINRAFGDVLNTTTVAAATVEPTCTLTCSLGPCDNYTVLNDSWRNVNTPGVSSLCDGYSLRPGVWYRLIPPAGNAIPETTPPIYSCGADAPMWLNGTHPTSVSSGPVARQLCANWNGNPCLWSTVVQVTLCSGGYYVYMAPVTATPACSLAWCGVNSVSSNNGSIVQTSPTSAPMSTSSLAFTSPAFNSSFESPCQNYTILNDTWRNVNTPRVSSNCDQYILRPGVWYRMMPPAGNSIPETTPPIYSCGTDAPMWLNGAHPTTVSESPVVRQLCANWAGNPCLWSTVVQVALCSGGYYLYMAPVTVVPTCSLTWCGATVQQATMSPTTEAGSMTALTMLESTPKQVDDNGEIPTTTMRSLYSTARAVITTPKMTPTTMTTTKPTTTTMKRTTTSKMLTTLRWTTRKPASATTKKLTTKRRP